jgi:glycosyltransferase involved in cell wall biosynthesis
MSEPLRVLQVLGSSAGGVARHVAQVAEGARGRGVHVMVAGPGALAGVVAPGRTVPFHAVEISDRPGPGDLTAVVRLRGLLRGADVVHAHGLRAGALVVLAARTSRRRPAVVVTLHNLPVGGRAIRAVAEVLERLVGRGADVVLGVSGDLVERARLRGARRAERALVPAPPRPAPTASREEVRAALGLGADENLVVTVARLAPQKGFDLLCDAAALLSTTLPSTAPPSTALPSTALPSARPGATGPSHPDSGEEPAGRPATNLLWVVAGDGPLREEIETRIVTEGLPIRLLGRREDVPDLMAAADVVTSTARWEGQPLNVQEALAVGAALVATDVGGTREVTQDAAVLVPVDDASALAAAVRSLLDDPARRDALRAAARARAAELPDLEQTLDQLARVWDQALRHAVDATA